jgi:hypothetical protein
MLSYISQNKDKTISYILRITIAFSFLYPPIAAWFSPDNWIWFVPDFVELFVAKNIFLHIFGAVEIVIALGILFLKNPFWPALGAAGILFAIIVLDWSTFDVVFRDISILGAALALATLHRNAYTL